MRAPHRGVCGVARSHERLEARQAPAIRRQSSNRWLDAQLRFRRDEKSGTLRWRAAVAEAIDDRIAPVAAKILPRHLYARRRLAALVFGEKQQPLDFPHGVGIVTRETISATRISFSTRHSSIVVERVIGRQRILILLVFAQFGGRRF